MAHSHNHHDDSGHESHEHVHNPFSKHDHPHNHTAIAQKEHDTHFHGPLPYFRSKIGLPFNPDFKFLILIVLSLLLLFLLKRVVILIVLLALVMAWDFILHYFHFPLHLDPLPFASFFVSVEYGLAVSILFMLIGGILPEMLVGHFDMSDFFSVIPIIAVNVILFSSQPNNFSFIAIIALLIYLAVTAGIALISASPPYKYTVEPIVVFIFNAVLIYRIAPLLFFIT